MKKIGFLVLTFIFSFSFVSSFNALASQDYTYYSKTFADDVHGDQNEEYTLCRYNYKITYTNCEVDLKLTDRDSLRSIFDVDKLTVKLSDDKCDSYVRDDPDGIYSYLVIHKNGDVRIRAYAPMDAGITGVGYNTSQGYYNLTESGKLKVNVHGGNKSDIKNFNRYSWCPKYLVIDENGNDHSGGKHTGYYFFGEYGLGTLRGLEARNQVFVRDDSNGGWDAFSKSDFDYITSVTQDFIDLNNNVSSNSDYSACDLSHTSLNTYNNLIEILNFVKSVKVLPYTMHNRTERLLENNGYTELVDYVIKTFKPDGVCYKSEYLNPENEEKYEKLYDIAIATTKDQDTSKTTVDSCDKLLGNPEYQPGEKYQDVAYYMQKSLDFVRILAPLLIAALSVYDYIRTIPSGDKDALNKVNKKTIIRIVAGIALFFAPILVKALFTLLGLYDGSGCNIS